MQFKTRSQLCKEKKTQTNFYLELGKVINMKQHEQSYNVKLNVMLVLIKLEIMKGLPIFVSTWGPNSKKLLYGLSPPKEPSYHLF
jgi:hypothetical protein